MRVQFEIYIDAAIIVSIVVLATAVIRFIL